MADNSLIKREQADKQHRIVTKNSITRKSLVIMNFYFLLSVRKSSIYCSILKVSKIYYSYFWCCLSTRQMRQIHRNNKPFEFSVMRSSSASWAVLWSSAAVWLWPPHSMLVMSLQKIIYNMNILIHMLKKCIISK